MKFPLLRTERQLSRFVLACVTLCFAGLIAASAAAGWFVMRAQDHAQWVEHTYEVERRVSTLRVLIERIEVARRGYLLSRQPDLRQTFVKTVQTEPALVSHIAWLTRDNASQQARLRAISSLLESQFHILASSMVLADSDPGSAATVFEQDQSLRYADKLRELTQGMLDEEKRLLDVRVAAERDSVRQLFWMLAVAGTLTIGTAILSIAILRRYTRGLINSRETVESLNAELEARVNERTRDLSRANEEIQRFAYIVSHDLRSPLVNVMGFTGELEAATQPLIAFVDRVAQEAPELVDEAAAQAAREDLPEATRFIRASTQKMDRLINAILRLSREGKRVLSSEPIALESLVDGIVATLQHRLDEIDGEVVLERPMPAIVTDRLALEQMISNLIENAIKYRKPSVPVRIVVSARVELGRVLISVADNGRGIDPRDHDRIFDLFRRSGTQDQPGEGIGLAHVRALAYRLGGLIDCRSALGEGATFTLSLPQQPLAPQG